MPGGARHVSERSENIIFEKFGARRIFFIPLASLSDEKQMVYGRSKKVTFQSDSCLDSGFSQVCGGPLSFRKILVMGPWYKLAH